MPLAPGIRLGPYEIIAPVGEGGMGEVYKARDTRLDRVVAIKVSDARFSERFAREARAVAAVNHPNICQLYDVGENYLVMEFIDGDPISAPDTPRKLLDQAVQIADGLSTAHAAGIIHRDLKPANILITSPQSPDSGRVKILDFGLAKSVADDPAPDNATRTIAITDPGTTVGTVAYMSPEQARGTVKLTPQSDQFSFGLVLYELCVGKRAFVRASSAETMTAIIREDADPLPATVPAPLRWVIDRLLAKEPADRYDTTRDLYRELRHLRDHYTETTSAQQIAAVEAAPARVSAKPGRTWPIISLAAAVSLAAGIALAAWLTPPSRADMSQYKFTPIARDEATENYPVWSPDGKSIAYLANLHGIDQVFTKVVGSTETAQLTHSDKSCSQPLWSRDGAAIYFTSDHDLWEVAASGGTPLRVLNNVIGVTLHPDGNTLLFQRDGKMWIASLKGGPQRELAWQPPRKSASWVKFSPDGSKLFVFDAPDAWIVPYPSGTARKIPAFTSDAIFGSDWLPDSRHLVTAELASGLSSRMVLIDVADGARQVIYSSPEAFLYPSVSPDGKRIAYTAAATEWDVLEVTLRTASVHTILGGGGISWWPDWAPSGTHYLVSTDRSGGFNILDISPNGFSRRMTEEPQGSSFAFAAAPRWAPDGTRFIYNLSDGSGGLTLMLCNASGGRAIAIASLGRTATLLQSWSPDSQWITAITGPPGKEQVVKIKPMAGAIPVPVPKAVPVAEDYSGPQWSPAGDWILYPSDGGMSLVSPDGATVRKLTSHKLSAYGFSNDGRQVYGVFHDTTGEGAQWQLYSVDVATGGEKMLAPVDLPASTDSIVGFSMHPGGQRFLTSIGKWPYDIWMLEGFNQPRKKTWLDRLLRR
jgi:serine/threonine protein kinase